MIHHITRLHHLVDALLLALREDVAGRARREREDGGARAR